MSSSINADQGLRGVAGNADPSGDVEIVGAGSDTLDVRGATYNDATSSPCRALYVGATGHITVITAKGQSRLFSNVPVGVLPVRCKQVKATGTTASLINAMF